MRRNLVWVVALLLLLSLGAYAQMRQERTEHHQKLDFFAGEWMTTDTVPPNQIGSGGVAHGKASFKWDLNNLWLINKYEGEMPGMGHYEGRGMITWDIDAGDYILYWFDNMGTSVGIYRGDFTVENTLVLIGEMEMQGTKYYQRLSWKKNSDKEILFTSEMSMDGENYNKMMESVYKR
jgi:hypothetical protein